MRMSMTRNGLGLAGLAVLVVFPHLANPFYVHQAETMAFNIMVAAGLWLAVGYTGVISVGHAAIMASGAYTAAYLSVNSGWGFLPTVIAGLAVSALLGLVLAIPTGRLTHFYFAMVTLGLAIIAPQLLLEWDWTGGYSGIFGVPAVTVLGYQFGEVPFYYLIIALAGGVVVLIRNIALSRWGRAFLMVRDDEVAASAAGVNPYTTKIRAFVISALPAGLAGVLFAYLNRVVTPGSFTLHLALFFLLAVVVGGSRSVYGSIGGVILLFALPELLREYRAWTNIIFGVILIAVLALVPGGLTQAADRIRAWWRDRRHPGGDSLDRELRIPADLAVPSWLTVGDSQVLSVRDVTKEFGGLTALREVDADIVPGEVLAIIGPNGSGKTTLLNIVSGFYAMDTGTVAIGTTRLPRQAAAVARVGIGRTFQTPKVLGDQSVLENVKAGLAAHGRATVAESALRLGRFADDERDAEQRARQLLAFVGLAELTDDRAGDLPHPHLRFLEIARALAARPRIVLLDEPAAGLSAEEVSLLNRIVRALAEQGIGVAIVEHNIGLVLDVADSVVVLDSGARIAFGTPADVQAMPDVARIYLGEDWATSHGGDPATDPATTMSTTAPTQEPEVSLSGDGTDPAHRVGTQREEVQQSGGPGLPG